MNTIGNVDPMINHIPSPVYINASAALSALGQGASNLASFVNAEKLQRLPQPLNCYYQAIPLAPIAESYQRIYQLLSEVIEQVIAEQSLSDEQLSQTSLFLGSSSMDIGGISSDEERVIWLTKLDHLNRYLVKKYGLSELHFTFSTACTSSCNALIYATRLVRSGQVRQALVIGCEFYNQLTLKGFLSLELLTTQGLHAFAPHRDGMVLGEGIGALLLSSTASDDSCLAMMEGYSSCDSYSLTTTEADGSKIGEVIEKSLQLSGLSAADIQLVKAHGTASIASDQAEANAIKRIFSNTIPALVLKPFIGHTLGACGVLEIALLIDLIKADIMPVPAYAQTLAPGNVEKTSPTKNLLSLVSAADSFKKVNYLLANHCGFGGNNAAVVLKNLLASDHKTLPVQSTAKPLTAVDNGQSQGQLQHLAQAQVEYDLTLNSKTLRRQVKQLTGFEVRRMDAFTLIALQALYELFTQPAVNALNLEASELGLYGVGEYFSVELLQSLVLSIEADEDVRPVDFISSVGNSANFYLAKQFNITGVNLFTGASIDSQQAIEQLAQIDLQLGIVDYSVVVQWQQNESRSHCVVSLLTCI